MYKEIKHFSGLNALRFFAAYLVVLHHAEQIRLKYEIFNLKHFSLFNNGEIAVTFFFVLSGFLISYLLLREINRTNNVSVRNFYTRRILRIWPLYFLLVIIGTLIVPYALAAIDHPYKMPYQFKDVILYFIFFAPFMVNVLFGHHLLEPLWSIGVEELFYILWAPLFKFLKKYILQTILSVIFIKILILVLAPQLHWPSGVVEVIKMLQFEALGIGGLAAYIIYNRKKEIPSRFLFSMPVQIIMFAFILLRIFAFKFITEKSIIFDYLYSTPVLSHLLLVSAFAWLIVNVSINKKSVFSLNNKVFEFLGDISYGIYMYHMLIIFSIVLILKTQLNKMDGTVSTIIFYVILTSLVLLVSFVSKKIFENYFLNLKEKFRFTFYAAKK